MAQFDKRLNRIITTDANSKEGMWNVNPFNGVSYAILGEVPNPRIIQNSNIDESLSADKQDEIKKGNLAVAEKANALYNDYMNNAEYAGTNSLMNPYTITRLYGSFDRNGETLTNRLVDSASTRKYYEIDGDSAGGYAKNPTTAAIIKWGAGDPYCRTPYQYQDFVFCKYWNKIPNNRLITLRRYPNPILDNLNYPTMTEQNSDGKSKSKSIMHPLATLVGYFGDETENKLSEILNFTTGMNWEETKSDFWTVNGEQEGMDKNFRMFGSGSWVSQHATELTNILGVLNPGEFNATAAMGLPPDPWSVGSYVNKVLGPVNVIDSVQKRQRGLKFTNDITLKFHYVARPIGGINAKAALLDILANVLVLGSASAQFFGGAHKFMIQPNRYPFNFNKNLAKLYKGDIFGATNSMINDFMDQATSGSTDPNVPANPSPIFKNLWKGFTEVLGDAAAVVKEIMSGNFDALTDLRGTQNRASTGVAKVVGERMRANLGTYPYLSGLRSLFTGMPVGDWHLTIGNPMNPIAMIGNLVCDEVNVVFGDELGPDDFPLEFTAIIKLKHGMPRDRDSIESMFNRGAGRIYDISDDFSSSADFETAVDTGTGGSTENRASKDWLSEHAKTTTGPFAKNLTIMPGYTSYANGKTMQRNGLMKSSEDLNNIASLRLTSEDGNTGSAGSIHILAPWALKNIM